MDGENEPLHFPGGDFRSQGFSLMFSFLSKLDLISCGLLNLNFLLLPPPHLRKKDCSHLNFPSGWEGFLIIGTGLTDLILAEALLGIRPDWEGGTLLGQLKMSEFGFKLSIFLNLFFLLGVLDGSLASLSTNARPGSVGVAFKVPD